MTRLLCLVMGVFTALPCTFAQFHFGIEGQGLACNLPGDARGGPSDIFGQQRAPRLAGGGGVWADIRLSDYIDFQAHMDLTPKGASLYQGGEQEGYFHATYLEFPLRLMYRIPVGYDDFFIGGGIYGAIGLKGTYRSDTGSTSPATPVAYSGNIHFSTLHSPSGLYFSPWDAGYTAAAAYQFSFGLVFHVAYERGLVNICPQGDGHVVNQGLSLGIGYLFHYNTHD